MFNKVNKFKKEKKFEYFYDNINQDKTISNEMIKRLYSYLGNIDSKDSYTCLHFEFFKELKLTKSRKPYDMTYQRLPLFSDDDKDEMIKKLEIDNFKKIIIKDKTTPTGNLAELILNLIKDNDLHEYSEMCFIFNNSTGDYDVYVKD